MIKNPDSSILNVRMEHKRKWIQNTAGVFILSFLMQTAVAPSLFSVTLEDRLRSNETRTESPTSSSNRQDSYPTDSLAGKSAVVIKDKVVYKDPRLSCILSFIVPGMGEYYLRNDIKGTIFFLTTTTVYLLSFYYLYQGLIGGSGAKDKLIIGGIGSVAALVLHIVGMVESYNDAVEINEARFYMSE